MLREDLLVGPHLLHAVSKGLFRIFVYFFESLSLVDLLQGKLSVFVFLPHQPPELGAGVFLLILCHFGGILVVNCERILPVEFAEVFQVGVNADRHAVGHCGVIHQDVALGSESLGREIKPFLLPILNRRKAAEDGRLVKFPLQVVILRKIGSPLLRGGQLDREILHLLHLPVAPRRICFILDFLLQGAHLVLDLLRRVLMADEFTLDIDDEKRIFPNVFFLLLSAFDLRVVGELHIRHVAGAAALALGRHEHLHLLCRVDRGKPLQLLLRALYFLQVQLELQVVLAFVAEIRGVRIRLHLLRRGEISGKALPQAVRVGEIDGLLVHVEGHGCVEVILEVLPLRVRNLQFLTEPVVRVIL